MEPLIYVMAILGCGDAGDTCTAVRTLPTTYATAERCAAASDAALRDSVDVDYPVVTVECRRQPATRLAVASR
ncbi:hypothetical protein PQ455_16995 [Sphingomonas naphthae]|uniref:Secreted protein n=1 Tax=Sphingomonas naphthae TaxID=1813468 RepID=A0ABY7TM17_9SPHN|nr:hypothetical protein [Sphingomonas naphthae]WCT73289.1 hypothetical protein PQ455_16995 [Sphingomonas naphthae]